MSLSTLSRIAPSRNFSRILVIRMASTTARPVSPKQIQVPSDVSGFFKYERDISRDRRFLVPQKKGDTPTRFLFRRLGHAYELYPLIFLLSFLSVVSLYVVYVNSRKIEIWIDRSQEKPPWDWERVRGDYWKKPTLILDPEGVTHRRLEVMENLQDKMVEAAKERGTR
ncbi:hypothetical protein FO519_005601 [Halicephalobus sp. NKZ332]|nr:hypothetical protein FO519_005601 [Halicephalobus sp. NKZ332]